MSNPHSEKIQDSSMPPSELDVTASIELTEQQLSLVSGGDLQIQLENVLISN